MNNKRVFFAVLAFASAFLTACGSTLPTLKPYHVEVQQGNVVDEKMMAQLHPGMTKSQVRFVLGTPLIQDSFHQNRWDYFYQIRKDGKINDQRRVILDFENDALKGIRGDVVPANSAATADDAPMAALSTESKSNASTSKSNEEISFWDHLKFWGGDEKPAAKAQAAKPAVESKPEQGKKSFWDRLKFWEGDDKPLPKADKSSDATAILMNKTALAHQLIASSAIASEVADATQQKEEVTTAVNAWADAWRNKNMKAYLAAYADQFMPEGFSSKKAWAAQRKQRIMKAGAITLTSENVNVAMEDQLATVTFDQTYSSGKFTDHMTKMLQLRYIDNRWLIVKESAATQSVKQTASTNASSATSTIQPTVDSTLTAPEVSTGSHTQTEVKEVVSKQESTKPETNGANTEPNIFERMLEKIGF